MPLTSTVSSNSSIASSDGTSTKVPVALVSPVGIVTVNPATWVKSVPSSAVSPVTVTATAVSVRRAEPSRVAVTVTVRAAPAASSATLAGETVRVTVVDSDSSSVIVSLRAAGRVTSSEFDALADTCTRLSAAVSSLLTPVIVTVPVLITAPATIVSVVPLRVKSLVVAGSTGVATTVIVVSAADGRSRVAVTMLEPAFSAIAGGVSTSDTTGSGSSFARVTVTPPSGTTVRSEASVVPVTCNVSSGSSVASSIGASSNVPVPVLSRAPMVTVKGATAV